jgi:hypothetical protein
MHRRASPTKAGTQTPGEVKSHQYRETAVNRAQNLIGFGIKNFPPTAPATNGHGLE